MQLFKLKKARRISVLACLCLMLMVTGAMAFTAPASGDFMYDLWDIGVNSILKGPIGFVGAMMAFVLAAILGMRQMVVPAVGTILAGVFLLKADSMITALGALIC